MTNQIQKFLPCSNIIGEYSLHRTRNGPRTWFLNASHDHAHVGCFNHNGDTLGLK
jgi:hypothetical protein